MANNFLETESEAPPIESYASAFQRRCFLDCGLNNRRNAAASVKVHVVDSNTFLKIDEMLINLDCSIITYSAFVIILAALSVVSSVVLYISLFITSSLYNYIVFLWFASHP